MLASNREPFEDEKKAQQELKRFVCVHRKVFPSLLKEIKRQLEEDLQSNRTSPPTLRESNSIESSANTNDGWDRCNAVPSSPVQSREIEHALKALLLMKQSHFSHINQERFVKESQQALESVVRHDRLKKVAAVIGSLGTLLGIVMTAYYNATREQKK